MGAFAVDAVPEHAQIVSGRGWAAMQQLFGQGGGWDVKAALWFAPDGFDAEDAHPPGEHTIALPLSISRMEGRMAGAQGVLRTGEPRPAIQCGDSLTHYVADGPTRFAHLYLPDGLLRHCAASLFGERGDRHALLAPRAPFLDDPELFSLGQAYVARASDRRDPPSALEMDARAILVLIRLLQRHSVLSQLAPTETGPGRLAPWQVRRVLDHLQDRLAFEVPLSELAALVRLSPHHFCRAFKASTGHPPHRTHLQMRVRRAQELLLASELSIADVAAIVGYDDPAQLARIFRKETGLSPAKYRASRRG